MNERIRELALQASEWYEQNVSGKGISGEWETKFAELIVAECSQISRDHQRIYYESHGDRIAKKIKEHFGVEE